MTRRPLAALVLALAMTMSAVATASWSSAAYTAGTTATASVTAAADWTPPSVALQAPASSVQGTVTLTASATDGETGVASVVVQYQSAGGSWVTVCTDTTSPYSCDWNTTSVADGAYSLRALAADRAGYSSTSAVATTTVANRVSVVLVSPGDVVRGTAPLAATISNGGALAYSVRFEYAVADSGSWKTICTDPTSPYACSWVTTSLTNQDYDLRAVATTGTLSVVSDVVASVQVDNTAPTVTMQDPGSPLRGVVTLASTAVDADSGLARVVIQSAVSGSSTYKDLCTVTASPYSCSFNTTGLADGSYSFRAVATDLAGNAATSTPVTNRVVDNTVSTVSVADPGALLSGTVSLVANASSTAGVASVRIQRAPGGTTAWTDVCTDTTAPYSCSWNTTTVSDGLYDLRAILVDGSGKTTTSATLAGRRVDNTPFRGVDVQATNGGTASGKLDVGDSLVLTYTDPVAPASITAGWNGSALAVTMRVRDGNLLGLGGSGDTLDVLRNGSAVNLGAVNLAGDYAKNYSTVQLTATMTMGTTTVNGVVASTVTLQVTAVSGSGNLRFGTLGTNMVWTPSALALDLLGRPVSTTPVTESGAADRDF